MDNQLTLWSFISDAGIVVEIVIFLLFLASIASWAVIFQRIFLIKRTRLEMKEFKRRFLSGNDLMTLYHQLSAKKEKLSGLSRIFYAGFSEFIKCHQGLKTHPDIMFGGTQRAMHIAQTREIDFLERNLNFLATVGSTSPYIGLFGTVWGIMTSFRVLCAAQQVTIAMVAPGISKALIATSVGLFSAIPAVIAYNRFSDELYRITQNYDTFQEEFLNILHHRSYT